MIGIVRPIDWVHLAAALVLAMASGCTASTGVDPLRDEASGSGPRGKSSVTVATDVEPPSALASCPLSTTILGPDQLAGAERMEIAVTVEEADQGVPRMRATALALNPPPGESFRVGFVAAEAGVLEDLSFAGEVSFEGGRTRDGWTVLEWGFDLYWRNEPVSVEPASALTGDEPAENCINSNWQPVTLPFDEPGRARTVEAEFDASAGVLTLDWYLPPGDLTWGDYGEHRVEVGTAGSWLVVPVLLNAGDFPPGARFTRHMAGVMLPAAVLAEVH